MFKHNSACCTMTATHNTIPLQSNKLSCFWRLNRFYCTYTVTHMLLQTTNRISFDIDNIFSTFFYRSIGIFTFWVWSIYMQDLIGSLALKQWHISMNVQWLPSYMYTSIVTYAKHKYLNSIMTYLLFYLYTVNIYIPNYAWYCLDNNNYHIQSRNILWWDSYTVNI